MLESKLACDSKILKFPAGEGLLGVIDQPEILAGGM